MSRKKKLFLNSTIGISSQIIIIICGFILPAAILSAYGSAANGLTNSIGQFLGLIQLCELGVGAVVQSSLYKPLAEQDNYSISCILKSGRRFFRVVGIILLIYVAVLCIIYPKLIAQFDYWFVMLMIIAISINSFANYYFGIIDSLLLTADQKAFIPLGLQACSVVLNTVICLMLINLGVSLLVVKFSTAIIYLIRPLAMYLYVKKNYIIDNKVKYEKEPINQKWNGLAQHLASVIVDHTDAVVLTAFSTLENVSIYAVYYMIVASLRTMVNSALSGVQAAMGNMLSRGEHNTLNDFFSQVEWVVHTVVTLLFTITGITIVPFIIIYTKNVNDANYIVPIFAILIVIANAGFCFQTIYKLIVKAAGHYKETQTASIIEAIINVAFSILLVLKFGLIGVAIGTILSITYRLLYHVWYIRHNILMRSYIPFIKQILIDIMTAISIVLSTRYITVSTSGYVHWAISAFEVSLISIWLVVVINLIFYYRFSKKIIKKAISIVKR